MLINLRFCCAVQLYYMDCTLCSFSGLIANGQLLPIVELNILWPTCIMKGIEDSLHKSFPLQILPIDPLIRGAATDMDT